MEFADFLSLCSTKSNELKFNSLERRNLYAASERFVGTLIEEHGIEKFKRFFKLCTHPSKMTSAYERVYGK